MGAGQREAADLIRYELGAPAARTRARWTALLGTAVALGPVALVVVIVQKLGWAAQPWVAAGVAALGVLALVRGVASYTRLRRRLRAFLVSVDGDELTVRTASAELHVRRALVARVTELQGALGGLRVTLHDDGDDEMPERIDIPRGGARYSDLRARLAAWRPIDRTRRRGFAARLVAGALVVAGIFFLPFFFEDFVVRSKPVALGLVLAMWLVARVMTRR